MLETLIHAWLGYVLTRFDQITDTWMFIAIYSTAMGIAAGGTRMKLYNHPQDGLQDAMRLAEAMNTKFVLASLQRDGAKAVLAVSAKLDNSQHEGLLIRYGKWLTRLNRIFETGTDLGTDIDDMLLISQYTSEIFGLPPEQGGIGNQGPPTALGVLYGIRSACRHYSGSSDLSRRIVLVQGVGSVGGALVDLLRREGCTVKFGDINPTLVAMYRDKRGLEYVESDAVYAEPCDVFSPCATGAVINSQTVPQLQASIVAGSANNQLEEPEDGEALHQRGILYAPDYVINAGAAIYAFAIELDHVSEEEGKNRVRAIGTTLSELFQRAQTAEMSPSQMAQLLADEKVRLREAQNNMP